LEFARYSDNVLGKEAIEKHAMNLVETDNRIHFHVWNKDAARAMFISARDYLDRDFDLIQFASDVTEMIAILRKR
jgi:hypothetical protein